MSIVTSLVDVTLLQLRNISIEELDESLHKLSMYEAAWGILVEADDERLDKAEMNRILIDAFKKVKPLLEKYRPVKPGGDKA